MFLFKDLVFSLLNEGFETGYPKKILVALNMISLLILTDQAQYIPVSSKLMEWNENNSFFGPLSLSYTCLLGKYSK